MNWFLIATAVEAVTIILLLWYIGKILKKFLFVSDHLTDLLDTMDDFSTHVEQVHELQMFYGDPTLEELIRHSKFVVEEIKAFSEVYSIPVEDDGGIEIDNDNREENDREEARESKEKEKTPQEES